MLSSDAVSEALATVKAATQLQAAFRANRARKKARVALKLKRYEQEYMMMILEAWRRCYERQRRPLIIGGVGLTARTQVQFGHLCRQLHEGAARERGRPGWLYGSSVGDGGDGDAGDSAKEEARRRQDGARRSLLSSARGGGGGDGVVRQPLDLPFGEIIHCVALEENEGAGMGGISETETETKSGNDGIASSWDSEWGVALGGAKWVPGAGDHGRSPPPVVKCVICVGGDPFSIPDLPGMTTGATTDPFRESSYGNHCEHTPAPTSPSAAAESTSSPVRRTMVSIDGGEGGGEEGGEEGKEGGAPRNVEVVEVVWKVAGGNVVGGSNEGGATRTVFRAIEYVIDRHMRQERCDGSVVMLYRRSEGHAAVALTIAVVCKQIARMRRWYLLHSPEYVDPDLSALDKSSRSENESYCFARHARLHMIEASSIIRLEVSPPPPLRHRHPSHSFLLASPCASSS